MDIFNNFTVTTVTILQHLFATIKTIVKKYLPMQFSLLFRIHGSWDGTNKTLFLAPVERLSADTQILRTIQLIFHLHYWPAYWGHSLINADNRHFSVFLSYKLWYIVNTAFRTVLKKTTASKVILVCEYWVSRWAYGFQFQLRLQKKLNN